MTQVVLQPSGNKGSREHYRNTIDELVDLAAHRDLLGEALFQHLISLFPSGQAPMWGVTPGQGDRNRASWQKIELGASALFAADKQIFSRGMIAAVFHNPPLARRLWGIDENGATWEYMYALDSVEEVNIPYAAFNAAVGYKSNNIIQGFTVLSEEKSVAFLQTFPASAVRVEWPATPDEVEEARRNLDGDLERRVEAWQRAEQSVLREALLRGLATGECALCGRVMDSRILVAAHIKKRSCCTDSEKRDITNIGMLNCKFGCDELYERGFVSIDENWSMIVAPSLTDDTALAYVMDTMHTSIAPRPASAKYFAWHRQHHNFE
ncbi:MAG: hypothetical protein ORN51_07080 [Akkermansiaceae bacterium]|nr:hypothetical protein [Akkermansiaceae bacterium]